MKDRTSLRMNFSYKYLIASPIPPMVVHLLLKVQSPLHPTSSLALKLKLRPRTPLSCYPSTAAAARGWSPVAFASHSDPPEAGRRGNLGGAYLPCHPDCFVSYASSQIQLNVSPTVLVSSSSTPSPARKRRPP